MTGLGLPFIPLYACMGESTGSPGMHSVCFAALCGTSCSAYDEDAESAVFLRETYQEQRKTPFDCSTVRVS